jgi:hypothetical protein
MTKKTGSSQNFFRTRRKAQNSRKKLVIDPSELVLERFGRGAGRLTDDPIALSRRLELSPHRVLAGKPHQEAHRRNNGVEQNPKNEWADDEVQQQTEFCPQAIERRESTRRSVGQHGEQRRQRKPVMPALAAIVDLSAPSSAKKPAKTRPKPRSDEVLTTSSRA